MSARSHRNGVPHASGTHRAAPRPRTRTKQRSLPSKRHAVYAPTRPHLHRAKNNTSISSRDALSQRISPSAHDPPTPPRTPPRAPPVNFSAAPPAARCLRETCGLALRASAKRTTRRGGQWPLSLRSSSRNDGIVSASPPSERFAVLGREDGRPEDGTEARRRAVIVCQAWVEMGGGGGRER